MMRPRFLGTIRRSTALAQSMGPRKFTSWQRHHSSGSTAHVGPNGSPIPALFTRRSMGPRSFSIRSTSSGIALPSVTSAGTAIPFPLCASIRRRVSARSGDVRAVIPTDIPAFARPTANACPRPRLAPVTRATLPFSDSVVMKAVYLPAHRRSCRSPRGGSANQRHILYVVFGNTVNQQCERIDSRLLRRLIGDKAEARVVLRYMHALAMQRIAVLLTFPRLGKGPDIDVVIDRHLCLISLGISLVFMRLDRKS